MLDTRNLANKYLHKMYVDVISLHISTFKVQRGKNNCNCFYI